MLSLNKIKRNLFLFKKFIPSACVKSPKKISVLFHDCSNLSFTEIIILHTIVILTVYKSQITKAHIFTKDNYVYSFG